MLVTLGEIRKNYESAYCKAMKCSYREAAMQLIQDFGRDNFLIAIKMERNGRIPEVKNIIGKEI